jgi:ribose-phosphate pyrophosphokinase
MTVTKMTVTKVSGQRAGVALGADRPMSSIQAENRKSLMLFSGRAFPELAEEIGAVLGVKPTPMDAYDFANGEIFVRYRDSVRGCDAFVVQSMAQGVNKWMMESLIMCDALKRGSAKRITVVLPYYPYSRQDKKHKGREPISARLMADLYKTAGADRILTVDLHTAQVQGFFDGPVDHLFAMNLLAEYVEDKWGNRPITVVAPDSGRVRVAERWTDRLGGCPLAFIHKTRDPLKPNQIVANRVVGEVEGRVCLIVDDMIDTGGTITGAAEILFDAGAADVVVAATHAVLSDPATERLRNSKISEVVITNTLPLPAQKHLDKITTLSIAPLLARAIREVFDDGSVTTLFGGLS